MIRPTGFYRNIKPAFISALLVLLPNLSQASPMESLRNSILTSLSKENRLKLHRNLPGFFAIPFLCKNSSESGIVTEAFPGDQVSATNESSVIQCGPNSKITLLKGATIKILQHDAYPGVLLLSGAVQIEFSGKIKIESEFFHLTLNGIHKRSMVAANLEPKSYQIGCFNGAARGDLDIKNFTVTGPSLLYSEECVFEVFIPELKYPKYLLSHDLVHLADLGVNKLNWRSRVADYNAVITRLLKPQTEFHKSIQASMRKSGEGFVFDWKLKIGKGPLDCALFSRKGDSATRQKVFEFKAPEAAGSIALKKEFDSYWTSMQCTEGEDLWVSNEIPPPADR